MARPSVKVADDATGVGSIAADLVERIVARRPNAVLALPTGRTPVPLYRELAARYQAGRIDFSKVRVFNLDEWVGVPPGSDGSFTRFMDEHLYSQVNVPVAQRFIPDGMADDRDAECRRYEEEIEAAGGIDLVILGLGRNGHIGFNEPGTRFDSRTHVVEVTLETRRANAYSFSDRQPPELGLSMGSGTILRAKDIVLLVTGAEKAAILARALNGPVDEAVPASVLQRHPSVHVVADRDAAQLLVDTRALPKK